MPPRVPCRHFARCARSVAISITHQPSRYGLARRIHDAPATTHNAPARRTSYNTRCDTCDVTAADAPLSSATASLSPLLHACCAPQWSHKPSHNMPHATLPASAMTHGTRSPPLAGRVSRSAPPPLSLVTTHTNTDEALWALHALIATRQTQATGSARGALRPPPSTRPPACAQALV